MSSPIDDFEELLRRQVDLRSVSRSKALPYPPPVGVYLAKGTPASFRAAMRRCSVTPAGLMVSWLTCWPYRLQVGRWTKKEIEKRYVGWPEAVQKVYVERRAAMAELVSVKGQLSKASRLACARFGAWRAQAASEVAKMPLAELKWAGLLVEVKVSQGPPGLERYLVMSDNYRGEKPKGAVIYLASEAILLRGLDKEAAGNVNLVKEIFDGSLLEGVEVATVETTQEGAKA